MVFCPAVRVTVQVKFPCAMVAGALLQVALAIPESVSEAVAVTVSCAVATVDPVAGETRFRTGAVLSILSVTEAVAEFPAESLAVLETTWFAASVVVVTGCGQVIVPEPPPQVKLTVTLVLFHPAAFGAGVGVAVIVNCGVA